jgi:hypothetical protein
MSTIGTMIVTKLDGKWYATDGDEMLVGPFKNSFEARTWIERNDTQRSDFQASGRFPLEEERR